MKEALVYVQSFFIIGLVLAGLSGIAYHLFRHDGWLDNAVGNVFGYTMQYPLIALFAIVGGIVLIRWWRHDQVTRGHNRLAPNIVLYGIMVAGAYFIGHFVLYGQL